MKATLKVPSSSREGMHHTVTIETGKPPTCTCEAFRYAKAPKQPCKHLRVLKIEQQEEVVAA